MQTFEPSPQTYIDYSSGEPVQKTMILFLPVTTPPGGPWVKPRPRLRIRTGPHFPM